MLGARSGAIPEVVDDPHIGVLVEHEHEDPGALARAMDDALALAADPATAGACRAHAERYSAERCIDAYLALYARLLQQAERPRRAAADPQEGGDA